MLTKPEEKNLETVLRDRLQNHELPGGRDLFGAIYEGVEKKKKNYLKWYISVAASLVLLLSAALFYYPSFNAMEPNVAVEPSDFKNLVADKREEVINTKQEIVQEKHDVTTEKNDDKQFEITESKPKIINFTASARNTAHSLPDGSIIYLDNGSVISYNSDFGLTNRNLSLEGKGFFEVSKNIDLPFVINTLKTKTLVTGTSFNLVSTPEREDIFVNSGTVEYSLLASKKMVKLTKGMEASVVGSGIETVLSGAGENLLAWRTGKLKFTNQKMKYVLPVLQEFWNKEFKVSDPSILECTFSGTFNNPKIDELMQVLSLTLQVDWKEDQHIIQLEGKGCR